jgi:hypothetical protein
MPTPGYKLVRAISAAPQADYNTPTPAGAGALRRIKPRSRKFGSYKANQVNDADAAHGYQTPTEYYNDSHETAFEDELDCSSEDLGYVLRDGLGGLVTSVPAGAPAGYKKHRFTLQDLVANAQLPCRTMVEKAGTDADSGMPSMCVQRIRIFGDKKGRIGLAVAWIGSGKLIEPSGHTMPALETGLHFFDYANAVLNFTDNVGVIQYRCDLKTWELVIENEFDQEGSYTPCAQYQDAANPQYGQVRSRLLLVKQTYSLSYTADFGANSRERKWLKEGRAVALDLQLVGQEVAAGFNHKLQITAARCFAESHERDPRAYVVGTNKLNLVDDPVSGAPAIIADLYNTVAAYS